jgi:hypothetical protein
MNDRKINIEEQIEQTLQSIEGIKSVEVSPYLYSKIKNDMQGGKIQNKHESYRIRYAIVVALIIILNVITLITFQETKSSTSVSASDSQELFAKEYFFTNNFYQF